MPEVFVTKNPGMIIRTSLQCLYESVREECHRGVSETAEKASPSDVYNSYDLSNIFHTQSSIRSVQNADHVPSHTI